MSDIKIVVPFQSVNVREKEDYFKLYEVTARAVKSVNLKLRVGGPSTSACKWIDEFKCSGKRFGQLCVICILY